MASVLERIAAACCPYPLVDLGKVDAMIPGQHYPTPKFCCKEFGRGKCKEFYRSLPETTGRVQCPHGFSVWPIAIGDARFAVTGLIGAPRLGGDQERLRAKENPQNRVDADAIPRWTEGISVFVSQGDEQRDEEFARRFDALHEIRRLNQIVKTNMERACTKASLSGNPDEAPEDLVRAFRASSLMSAQMDALDLLANPGAAADLVAPRRWVFYRIVDKMVRIYRVVADTRQVRLRLTGGSVAEALLDLRTIHVIPSVFIDNAVKYSQPGDLVEIRVFDDVRESRPVITVEVVSTGPAATAEEERALFVKPGRGTAARAVAQGSGVGLTVAKIVADQHGGWITADQRPSSAGRAEWTFRFQVGRAPGTRH